MSLYESPELPSQQNVLRKDKTYWLMISVICYFCIATVSNLFSTEFGPSGPLGVFFCVLCILYITILTKRPWLIYIPLIGNLLYILMWIVDSLVLVHLPESLALMISSIFRKMLFLGGPIDFLTPQGKELLWKLLQSFFADSESRLDNVLFVLLANGPPTLFLVFIYSKWKFKEQAEELGSIYSNKKKALFVLLGLFLSFFVYLFFQVVDFSERINNYEDRSVQDGGRCKNSNHCAGFNSTCKNGVCKSE